MIFINYCRNSMMKVNQLNQVVAAWLLIMATAVSMNAEIYPDELDGMHLRCPGGYYIIDSHHYTIKLFLRDGFNSIEGSTDINFELSKTNQIFREDRKKDSTKSRMCCETERNCQLNLRMDDKLVISDVSRDVRLERRGSIKSALGFGRENIMNIERTNDNNGDELIISIRFRSKLGSSYQGKLSIAYTRPSGAFKKVKGVKDHLITVDPLIMSKRLLRGQIFQLYPYFTLTGRRPIDPELEVIIEQPDVDNIVVTNAPWDGHSVELVQIEHPKHAQSDSLHELSFAVGPFNRETLLHSNNNILKDDYPVIRKIQSSDALEGFAGKFLKQTLDWLHNHSPPNWDKQIDSRYVFGYKFLAISPEATDIVYSQEPTVETALTVALRTARKWLSVKRPKSSCYSYVIEGLAVYFAIRMVRELEPSLKVDKYVRETLLPRALDYEIEAHYEELSLDYFYEFSDNRRVESIWWWRIKSAAIIEMMKRFLSQDQQAFDRSVLALLNYPKSNWIGPEEVRETFTGDSVSKFELHSFLSTWRQHSGYPYIGVSLDKQDSRSIRFDQVPIDWLHNKNNQIQSDHVWPMSLTMKFSDGIKTETIEMTSREGFNGKRVAVRLKLPNWFEHDNPEHKLWLDQGELFYYRVSYSSDLNAMSERNL